MQVQINFGDLDASDAIADHVHDRLDHALRHLRPQVTRVEVHLHDDKQKRHGPDDTRCLIEARIAGQNPLAVTHKADNLYDAISHAAEKVARAVEHKVARRSEHRATG